LSIKAFFATISDMESTTKGSKSVVTRIAPSPTGKAHAGTYRTAMYAWLFARKHKGKFILRIEDTDTARNDKEAEQDIYEALEWLGLNYDETYIQSEHVARHKEVLEKMIADGHAYISKEEAKDGSGVIKEIVRFKNPKEIVSFHDEIKGTVTMDTTDLGDFVIAKNINEPLFHLAVVVDDFDEGVTHVIRGEDHVSNTPRQILIQRAIGAPTPIYAHLPLVLGTDKQKLSKRKGALAITEYRDRGYLPEAILNMVTMVGWNPGTEQELFTKEELIQEFDLAKVQKSSAVFNEEKLDWFNREYIKKLSQEEFWGYAHHGLFGSIVQNEPAHHEILKKIEPLLRERMTKFSDMQTFFGRADGSTVGEFDYFFKAPVVDDKMLVWKDLREDTDGLAKTKEFLKDVAGLLEAVSEESWSAESVKAAIWSYAEEKGKGLVLWPLRVSLSGREKSPDPFELAGILGKAETIKRINSTLVL
jgi:glutamyl-tRNA synthetase